MMMTLLTCMTCSVSADASGKSRKSMAGIDMIAAGGKKDLRFSFGHAVGKHWTAGAAVSVYTGTVTGNEKGSEMYEHELEFSDIIDDKEESMEASHSETVLMQFWPRKTYEGMFLMIGGRYMNGDGLECILGIGCYLTLWKGLKAAVSIETGLKHAVGNSRLTGLGLCYIF